MKLTEAIKRNVDIQVEFLPLPRHRDWQAVQLGIEALKREQILRHEIPYDRDGLLPGETEE